MKPTFNTWHHFMKQRSNKNVITFWEWFIVYYDAIFTVLGEIINGEKKHGFLPPVILNGCSLFTSTGYTLNLDKTITCNGDLIVKSLNLSHFKLVCHPNIYRVKNRNQLRAKGWLTVHAKWWGGGILKQSCSTEVHHTTAGNRK